MRPDRKSFLFLLPLLSLAVIVTAAPANAQRTADPASIWTLQDENSSIATGSGLKDKYYVNGLRLNFTSPTDTLPASFSNFDDWIWGPGRSRYSFELSQSIYTPANVLVAPPNPRDRPYAGVLTVTSSLLHDSGASRSILGIQAGLVGPDALAKQVQNGFHSMVGYGASAGWNYQIHDEPVADLLVEKIWRVPLARIGGVEMDALPEAAGGAGNLRDYGLAGSVFRVGQGLDSDYGVARVNPGLSGGDVFMPSRDIAWYAFAGADGQAVAHDITIDGNTFRTSAKATRVPFVGEMEIGFAVIFGRARLSYTQVIQTEEVKGQQGGLHQFGSLALSLRY
ncbi:MAG: lipid A deacylase LpxR family protein [Stellaceae bacterium]